MNLTVVTAPTLKPFTLNRLYQQLRLDVQGSPQEHDDDDTLNALMDVARAGCENIIKRSLLPQTLRLSMQSFPVSSDTYARWDRQAQPEPVRAIKLYRPPVIAVSHVKYYDSSNVLQTLDASSYFVTDDQVPELKFVSGFTAPSVYDRPDAVRVEYTAGYANAALIPEPLQQWMLLQIGTMYESRQSVTEAKVMELPNRFTEMLLDPYTLYSL